MSIFRSKPRQQQQQKQVSPVKDETLIDGNDPLEVAAFTFLHQGDRTALATFKDELHTIVEIPTTDKLEEGPGT